jgi:hypothetical protein
MSRLLALLPITLGLLAEVLILWLAFRFNPKRALIATIAMNVASAGAGLVLIPLLGIAWEIFPGLVFYHAFHMGTFNPVTWAATFVMAVAANSVVELATLKKWFAVPWNRRNLLFLGLANTVSVGMAYVSFLYDPLHW